MNIKTLSQITPLIGDVHVSSYVGVSQYSPADSGKYSSRKVMYGQLSAQLSDEIDKAVLQGKYHALSGGAPVNITTLRTDLNRVMTGDYTFGGVKKFSKTPQITETVEDGDGSNVPNVKLVSEMIGKKAGFMAENQWLPMDPENGAYHTAYDENEPSPKQMYWHIDHNQRDSSTWKDEYGAEAGPAICKYTGNLVCYGWLADNGNVKPGCAWVGLFGRVLCGNAAEPSWVALQIQPWIIGKYSSTAQYVSFNIPVKRGLQLKIMTGFNVNGNNSGLHGDTPTLMFTDAGNLPNTFVGYIFNSDR